MSRNQKQPGQSWKNENMKELFQSPPSLATSKIVNGRLVNIKTGKPVRIINPTKVDTEEEEGNVTEVIENEDEYVLLPQPDLSRHKTLRLPYMGDYPDLIPDMVGPQPVSSQFDELEDGQYVTRMNTIDESSDDDLFEKQPIKRTAREASLSEEDEVKQVKGQGKQVKRYCFTWNNPTMSGEEFKELLENTGKCEMGCFQLEMGENETPHFQGYVELKKANRTTFVHNMVKPYKMHWEYAESNRQANYKYCTKTEGRKDGPWFLFDDEQTFQTKGQGRRSDLNTFKEDIEKAGGMTEDIKQNHYGLSIRYGKWANQLEQMCKLERAQRADREYWKEQARKRKAGLLWKVKYNVILSCTLDQLHVVKLPLSWQITAIDLSQQKKKASRNLLSTLNQVTNGGMDTMQTKRSSLTNLKGTPLVTLKNSIALPTNQQSKLKSKGLYYINRR